MRVPGESVNDARPFDINSDPVRGVPLLPIGGGDFHLENKDDISDVNSPRRVDPPAIFDHLP